MSAARGAACSSGRTTLLAVAAASGVALAVLLTAGLPPGHPVNDAAAYHRMVELWHHNGGPTFVGWNEMTLLGHLAPAVILHRLGGESVVARQLLVGFASVILTALLCWLVMRSGLQPGEAVPVSLSWLANPVTLLAGTCFMTEAPQSLWCVAWLAAYAAWCRRGGAFAAAGWTTFAVAAFAVRQTGVVLPVAAAVACLVARSRRGKTLALAAGTLAVDAILWVYRGSLPLASVRPLGELMVDLDPLALAVVSSRHGAEGLATVGLWLAPVAVAAAIAGAREAVSRRGAMVAAGVALLLLLAGSWFPFWPNTVTREGLLPDTLPPHGVLPPVFPDWVWVALTLVGVASLAVLASRSLERVRLQDPQVVAALAASLGFLAVTAVSRSPFDRYLVVVVPLALVAVTGGAASGRRRVWPTPALVVLAAALLVSAWAVRGLHERQREVWRTAEELVAAGLPADEVDGGFEWNLWHQPLPFVPAELRDPSAVLVWYESYPFTRLEAARRLWVGAAPEGWRELSSRSLPDGRRLLVLAPCEHGLWREIRDHVTWTWAQRVIRDPERAQPPLPVLEGTDLVFYWDTYFTNVGLLRHTGLAPLARANVDHLLRQVDELGFVPNANQPWGRNRSQPPYLALMVRELWDAGGAGGPDWLGRAYRSLLREYRFWTTDEVEERTTPVGDLVRYSHHASASEATYFYDHVLVPRLDLTPLLSAERKVALAGPLLAEAASGMDFTPRFEGRCDQFVPVDLNVNLVLYEQTFAWMVEELGLAGEPDWRARARSRWQQVEGTCWSEERGLFMDWDFVNARHGAVASVAAFHPLWAGLASAEQAARTVASLPLFEHAGGVAVCEPLNRPSGRQWGEGAVWAPLQQLVVVALDRYGYRSEAVRVASRYLDTVAGCWRSPEPSEVVVGDQRQRRAPGRLYEKYTVDGRVNDTEYPAGEGYGWTAGVFLYAHDYLCGAASPAASAPLPARRDDAGEPLHHRLRHLAGTVLLQEVAPGREHQRCAAR